MPSSFPVVDLHQDLLLHINRRDLYPSGHWQTSFQLLEEHNVKLSFVTAFPVPPDEKYFDPVTNNLMY